MISISYQLGVMSMVKITLSLVALIGVRWLQWVSSITLLIHQEEMIEIEIEVKLILWVMADIIPIYLVVDVMVPMAHQMVVAVVHLMILQEAAQIDPLLLN